MCVNRLFRPRGLRGFGGGDADGGGDAEEGGWKGGWARRRMEGRLGRAASRGPCERVSFRLFMGVHLGPCWGSPATSPAQFSGGDFKAQLQLGENIHAESGWCSVTTLTRF